MKIDINRLRFKDWKEIEALTQQSMGTWVNSFSNGLEGVRAEDLEAVIWVAGKRDNPAFTREEASELGPADLNQEAADPTESGGASPTSPPSATSGA